MLKGINLQLFADPDEGLYVETDLLVEDEPMLGNVESDEEELPESLEAEDEETEEPIEEIKATKQPDKITKRLIKEKQENKELKRRLFELERKETERETLAKKETLSLQYLNKGYDEESAKDLAEKDIRNEDIAKRLDRLEYERKAERLESKYPDIWDNLDYLISQSKKSGFTLEEVCAAKLNRNAYDSRIQNEQANLIKRKKVTSANTTGEVQGTTTATKLNSVEEREYLEFVRITKSKATREQFKQLRGKSTLT